MRYINIEDIELPPDWERRAQQVLGELISADPTVRKSIISRKSQLWKDLKQGLSELSYDKCWYCESKQIRSDNPVDHFRPKNEVAECDDHPGYWWLAFDWHNYRFSCTYCNSYRNGIDTSGGKQDCFPLCDEKNRARSREDDISLEKPLLLDPTNPDDPKLLWFYIDGTPVPKFGENEDEIKYRRAKTSIRLYHLNEEGIEERRRELYEAIRRLVARGNEALDDAAQALNAEVKARAKKRFANVIKEITELLADYAEFSSAAKIYLSTFATSDPEPQGKWIKVLLKRIE